MSAISSPFLRAVIAADAVACGVSGGVLILDTALVAGPLGMAAGVMQAIGIFLVAYAAALALAASRPALPRGLVWALVALNVAFAADSVVSPLLGWAQPSGLGWGILAVQAVGALIVADLQYLALRKDRRAAMAA